MRSRPTRWGLLGLALVSLTCGRAPEGSLAGRPVVVILFDALSARHVHHLGYARETTPTLDHIASQGLSFTHAFSPAPYTLASIPSLLTGTLPDRHKVVQVERGLGEDAVTLAESLGAAGYQTFAAVANIKGGSLHHDDQGFEVFEELYAKVGPDGELGMRIVAPGTFTGVLERWCAERDPTRPPLFYLHVLQPHLPYAPPPPHHGLWLDPFYTGRFKDGLFADDLTEFIDHGGKLRVLGPTESGSTGITRADQDALVALYDANVHYADRALADMLGVLDEAGILEDALLVITSDHGEALWEHGRFGHNNDVYDEMVGVPLVLRFPTGAGPEPGLRSELVSTLDIMPTVLALLDLPAPAGLDGYPLPFLGREAPTDRALYLRNFETDPTIGLRATDSKVILAPAHAKTAEERESFDLVADPLERRDLGSGGPDAALWQTLEERRAQLASLPDPSQPAGFTTTAEAELIQKLGYTE
jgi:arylsulfatase A-like enzyme